MHKELTDDERLTAIGLFAEAFGGLSARFAAQIAEHQLAPVEFEVLLRLSRSPGGQLRMTDLSTQTGITTSGVTRVVDRLERDGLFTGQLEPAERDALLGALRKVRDAVRPNAAVGSMAPACDTRPLSSGE
ncbi:MAG: hypothetical protein AUI10_03555 [Actinobacteria bacterium 13_2_20CM_2_72_6]|nr:MAG: hypothetical protein AUI10_03555 [Actinobacteria bacterium 13_2_20CM_2_72_6]